MKRFFLATTDLAMTAIILSAVLGISSAASTCTSTFTAAQAIPPSEKLSPSIPASNSWGFDSYIFFEVSIPVFDQDEVELDEEIESDFV